MGEIYFVAFSNQFLVCVELDLRSANWLVLFSVDESGRWVGCSVGATNGSEMSERSPKRFMKYKVSALMESWCLGEDEKTVKFICV
jgi:hypothetical protein